MVRPAIEPLFLNRLIVDATTTAYRLGSTPRRVERCRPDSFDECIKKSTFSLGVGVNGNMTRVRVLLRKRELSGTQLHSAHASILNAYMMLKESPTYEWEVKTDPVSYLVDSTQREFQISPI